MRGIIERRMKLVGAVVLGGVALTLVLVALQERATAEFLSTLGRTPGLERETASGSYWTAFWFDLGAALALVGAGVAIARTGSRMWFGLGLLFACFALGSGLFALSTTRAEMRTALPLPAVAWILLAFGGFAVLATLIGLMASAALPPRQPANPPVPPSHQAG